MTTLQAVLLGAIQGLTEFLPISSSGHLVLFQKIFGLTEPNLFFDVSVHTGTLIAVIFFFHREIRSILTALYRTSALLLKREITVSEAFADAEVRFAFLICVGSIPTAILGLMFHRIAEQLFSSIVLVGFMLLVTGTLLWGTRYLRKKGEGITAFSVGQALLIGLVQGLAILPGISRSGSTIATGLFLGIDRKIAARYSFLLSIPAIVGAQLLSLKDLSPAAAEVTVLFGAITACVVGYSALALLVYIVNRGQMHLFAPYCWIIGVTALLFGW